MQPRNFESANLSRGVLRAIAGRILSGELPAGTAIGNELSLMQRYGVSRTVVREAVRILFGKGFVEIRPRTGTRVLPREHWNLLDADVLGWMFSGPLSAAMMRELHEVRCIIEPAAAALAATRATEEQIQLLQQCCTAMDAADRDVQAFNAADLRFHTTILAATQNRFMSSFAGGIRESLLSFFRATGEDPDAFVDGRPRHHLLADAIARRDPAAARAAADVVLEGAWRVIDKLDARNRN